MVRFYYYRHDLLALDKASVRRLSADGHLHVDQSNISAARVDPYWGREIPDSEQLGLDPDQKYMLWRHPEELKKAAATFNNLPILAEHVPVTADKHKPDLVVGSTGTDAQFDGHFLKNSLVFWPKPAIDAIVSGKQRQLSCAYHYTPIMQPGVTPDGIRYDGIMTNLHGNHVALVEDGRAGDQVMVADSMPPGLKEGSMATKAPVKLSPAAQLTKGALYAYLEPKLAQDARGKLDYNAMVSGINSKNYWMGRNRLQQNVQKVAGKALAQDADLQDLCNLIDALKGGAESADQTSMGAAGSTMGASSPPPPPAPDAAEEDVVAKIKSYLEQEGVSPDIINNLDAFVAEAAAPPPNGGPNGGPSDNNLAPNSAPPPVARHSEDAAEESKDLQDLMKGDNADCPPGQDDGGELGVIGIMDPQDLMKGGDQSPANQGNAYSNDEDEDDRDNKDKAEDEEVPNEQEEQLGGVPTVSSEGKGSTVKNGSASDRRPAHDSKFVTRAAMDQAIKIAQDAAIKNQRAIYAAERFVAPWVGQIAMDANTPADVYRGALKALGVRGADKMHPDALRPVLEAQPKPSQMVARQRTVAMAQDSGKIEGSFLDRFPEAAKIRIQ